MKKLYKKDNWEIRLSRTDYFSLWIYDDKFQRWAMLGKYKADTKFNAETDWCDVDEHGINNADRLLKIIKDGSY